MTERAHFQGATRDQGIALDVAHDLADMGVPIFAAHRNSLTGDFLYPTGWQHTKAGQVSHNWIDRWRPGMALCMVTGVVFDVLDVDPRNGGREGFQELADALNWDHSWSGGPIVYGMAETPSRGEHTLIGRTHLAKGKPARGVDLQAGADDGTGRGFIFIAPTVRISKYGPNEGREVAYRWRQAPDRRMGVTNTDPGLTSLIEHCQAQRAPRRLGNYGPGQPRVPELDNDAFDSAPDWTPAEADKVIDTQLAAVRGARVGEINNALGGAARVLGRFVAGGHLAEDHAAEMLMDALNAGGVHSDAWNVANGKSWTAATCIAAGLANGAEEPWTVETETAPIALGAESGSTSGPMVATPPVPVAPALLIESAATMAYWLQNSLGSGALSGFFLRGGQVVHTARVDEAGYVHPKDGKDDDNGPAQVQPVSPGALAAKVQFAFRCYKTVKDKETGSLSEVPALFPLQAAQRAVDAPEAMGMLRTLRGLTHTPMVRADGSVLAVPGYDKATGYLFLPTGGLAVPPVPMEPSVNQVGDAVALLDEMTAGFPWDGQDDRANYYGLLLTPLLRLLTPPAYKMFGIGAHQPGSGKTLLADIATILHGGVLRSEMPEDETEMRKQVTSILSTTSAPVVHVDNVTGVLRSPVLAGVLTATAPVQDRELGSSRMLEMTNDRVWVVTGNNLSLGGDLVRRTVIISIDPNTARPEERSFQISDLKAWTREHRNELLWALLVLVRNWVAQGSRGDGRKQSDSYAVWRSTVGGILAAAGVPGRFDARSGERAAAGGDDDGLAQVLEHAWRAHEGRSWSVAEILSGTGKADGFDFVVASRDWLPMPVLDKLARSEAGGRKSFGRWLLNRRGRWVSGPDGHSYVLRQSDADKWGARWAVERTP